MKVEFVDGKKNVLRIFVETEKDLWYLYRIIDPGDVISGHDFRVLKSGSEDKSNKQKVRIWLKIEVKDVKFHEYSDVLRVSGQIIEASEYVGGKMHTFTIKPGKEFTLEKKRMTRFHLREIERARRSNKEILVVSLDDREFAIGKISNRKIEILYEDKLGLSKEDPSREDVFTQKLVELAKKVIEISSGYHIIAIASPMFWKDKLLEEILERAPELKQKIKLFTISTGGIHGIYEFSRREEYLQALQEVELMRVNNKISEFLRALLNGLSTLGMENVKFAAESGAVEFILIDEEFFRKMKENGQVEELISLFKLVEDLDGEIYFVNRDNANYDLIHKYGVVAKLRYKLS